MKIGMLLPNYARWFRAEQIWTVCEKAKEMGLESLFFVDHVMARPHQTVGMGNGYMDIYTAMSYVAAVTNIQGWAPTLGQCIVVVPYRPAIQQAKIAATVDSLSNGRLLIGAGTGYLEVEFNSLGLNVHERGDMTDEYLKAMIELWTHPVASFHGKYINFDEMTISVRPTQQPHPPILVGARGKRPFRRIAEFCQGWVPNAPHDATTLKTLEQEWAEINTLWKQNGREGKPMLAFAPLFLQLVTDRKDAGEVVTRGIKVEGEFSYTPGYRKVHVQDMVKKIHAFSDAGAEHLVLHLPSYRYGEFDNQSMLLNQMEILAEHVLPKVRKG